MALRPTLADVRHYGEYATTFRWALSMQAPAFMGIQHPVALGDDGPIGFNVLCESTDLPTKTVDKILIGIRGHKHYQPGIVTPSSTIQFNFVENVDSLTHRWLLAWQEAIWAHNTGIGVPYLDLVAENVFITRFSNDDKPICAYVLRYCFLENYSLPRLDGTTSGPFNVSVTLSYDDFYVKSTDPYVAALFSGDNMNAMNYPY